MQKNKVIFQSEPLITKSDKNAVKKYILSDGWITENKVNAKFEKKFSSFVKSKYAVSFPNGTLTLFAMLKCLNLKPNSEVIVPSYTMVATANAVLAANCKVKFADIEKDHLCMCPKSLIKLITNKTRVVIYVTLNGRLGKFKKIKDICREKKITLIEDCAHSIGSFTENKIHHGTESLASSFSFSTPKLFTTGQGGMVVTNNKVYFKKLKKFKNFGRLKDGFDFYEDYGLNLKFTDLQATLGISQMKNLRKKILVKKSLFNQYFQNLKDIKEIEIKNFKPNECPWFIDIYVKNPKKLQNFLKRFNIVSRLVYPSLNKQKFFNTKINCPNAQNFCNKGLWLPSSLKLRPIQVDFICKIIKQYFNY